MKHDKNCQCMIEWEPDEMCTCGATIKKLKAKIEKIKDKACDHLDAPYRNLLKERDKLKDYIEDTREKHNDAQR